MPIINIVVRNKIAKVVDGPIYICNNSDYIVHFDFDLEWYEWLTKTARFNLSDGRYIDKVFTGTDCYIPPVDTNSLSIGVYAGDIHTSTPAYITCIPSVTSGSGTHMDPQPDIYNQIMDLINNTLSKSKTGYHQQVGDYLFESIYSDVDYDYAERYFNEKKDVVGGIGACSSVRNGNWFGRNLDWIYDDSVSFVVKTRNEKGHFASVGVSGAIPGLTIDMMEHDDAGDILKIVPFYLQDGINEHGLVVSTNVVPTDYGFNEAEPYLTEVKSICSIMLCRYILDNFKTAEDALYFISNYVRIWFPKSLHDMGYEQHWMIADKNDTYILEIVDNEAVVLNAEDTPYMTNFYLDGVTPYPKVYTPETLDDGDPVVDNGITEHGSGLERFNLIVENYANCGTKDGMINLMRSLKYTRAYNTSEDVSDPYWYTEFVGGDLKCNSPVSEFTDICNAAGAQYLIRTRHDDPDKVTWQTVHTSVYDIEARSLYLMNQEEYEVARISFNPFYEELFDILRKKMNEPDTDGTNGQVLATDGNGNRFWKTDKTGSMDYNDFTNKPQINGNELFGNKSAEDLGLIGREDIAEYRKAAAQDIIDAGKQATISDLETIRSGAALGATALQEHQSLAAYRTSAEQDVIDATKADADEVVTGVQVAGVELEKDADGKINVPKISSDLGVARVSTTYGINATSSGILNIVKASEDNIAARAGDYKPIVPKNLDYAVKAAMCDGRGAAWSDAEKAAARDRMDAADRDSLNLLWKYAEGNIYSAETDTAEAYAKTIKSGVVPEGNKALVGSFGGKSVVRNQLINYGSSSFYESGTGSTISRVGNAFTVTGSGASSYFGLITPITNKNIIANNKYYLAEDVTPTFDSNNFDMCIHVGDYQYMSNYFSVNANVKTRLRAIITGTAPHLGSNYMKFITYTPYSGAMEGQSVEISGMIFVNLTQWFGSGNEPTTVDDPRIAEIERFLSANPGYYNTGEIVSAETQMIVSRGKNLWNCGIDRYIVSSAGFISKQTSSDYLGGNGSYLYDVANKTMIFSNSFGIGAAYVGEWDSNDIFLGRTAIVGANNSYTFKPNTYKAIVYFYSTSSSFVDISNATIQAEIGSTATPYIPYMSPDTLTIPDSIKALDGYGWSAGSVYNEVDFARKKFIKRVKHIVLDGRDEQIARLSVNTTSNSSNNTTACCVVNSFEEISEYRSVYRQGTSNNFIFFAGNAQLSSRQEEFIFGFHVSVEYSRFCYIRIPWTELGMEPVTDGTHAAEAKQAFVNYLQNNPIDMFYEIDPIETDISDLITDMDITVESGGTVTFEQQDGGLELSIPNSISYLRKIEEALA